MGEPEVGSVVGGVRLDEVLGRGGMGVVFKGHDPALNRTVAVKVVRGSLAGDDEFRRRFSRECEVAASLDHPHVVPIHSAGEEDGQLYVVMRHVPGTDLRAAIRAHGGLPLANAARIVEQVASALDAAHRRRLVHRDVKPANILVTSLDDRPHAYLTDFGLARLVAGTSGEAGLTTPGALLGTLDYMAPEQYDGAVDHRADVYALGCVLYEAVTGVLPFPRGSDPARMSAHLLEAPPGAATEENGLPPELDAVLAKAMAKEPLERFYTAGELGRAVTALVGDGTRERPRETTTAAAPVRQSAVPTRENPLPVPSAPSATPTVVGPWRPGTRWPAPSGGSIPPGSPSAPGGSLPPAGSRPGGSWPQPGSMPGSMPPGSAPGASWPQGSAPGSAPGSWPAPATPPRRNRRRWWLAGGAVVAVLVVAAAVVGVVVTRPSAPPAPPAPVATLAGAPIPIGRDPVWLIAAGGFLWSANDGTQATSDGNVSKIDPRTGTSQTITVGGDPSRVVADAGAVWVANYTDEIERIDIATGDVKPVSFGQNITALAVGGGYTWASDDVTNTVTKINDTTQAVEGAPIPVGKAPRDVLSDNGRLYVSNTGDRTVTVIDESTGAVVGSPIGFSSDVGNLFAADGTLYVSTFDNALPADRRPFVLTPVDEASLITGAPVALGDGSVADSDGKALWVSYPFANEVRKLDPRTGAQLGPPLSGVGRGVGDMTFSNGDVWISNTVTNTVVRAHLNG